MNSQSETGSIGHDDRVKPCLQCESILPFDAETCSLCGATCRPDAGEEAVKPCLTCGALIPETGFFCPECGDYAADLPSGSDSIPPLGERERGALTVLSRMLAWSVAIAAILMVASATLDLLRLRN